MNGDLRKNKEIKRRSGVERKTGALNPAIASQNQDSGQVRIDKIEELIRSAKYSIHDLSRCEASSSGETYRLKMPFELGFDFGYWRFGRNGKVKRILVLEEQGFSYQRALSDLSGCDIQTHRGNPEYAIRKLRNWLVDQANAESIGAQYIMNRYVAFQEWHYERQLERGFSEDDIQDYPTSELLEAMRDWKAAGQPVTL